MRQSLRHLIGLVIIDADDFIKDLGIEYLRHEACPNAFDLMGGRQSSRQDRRGGGLHGDDLHLRVAVL